MPENPDMLVLERLSSDRFRISPPFDLERGKKFIKEVELKKKTKKA